MDIKEQIVLTQKKLKEIKVLLLQRPLKKNQFSSLKAELYELSFSLQELEKKIYVLREKELNTIIKDSAFPIFYEKIKETFAELEEEDIQMERESYFVIFNEELEPLFASIKETLQMLEERFLTTKKCIPIFTKKYLTKKRKSTYAHNEKMITAVEEKIVAYFNAGRSPGGSTLAKRDVKTEHLHAWIPAPLDNHRILYDFDPQEKKIIFLDLGTHKELRLGSGK